MTTKTDDRTPGAEDTGSLADRLNLLTRRESEVLEYLVKGMSNDQIAMALFRSPKTIDKHCQNIYQKTGIHKRVNLVREVLTLRSDIRDSVNNPRNATVEAVEELVKKSRAWDKMAKYESILSRSSGPEYFGDLAKALAETFGVKMAGISEINIEEGYGDLIAFCTDGELQVPFRYPLTNSACGITFEKGEFEKLNHLEEIFSAIEECQLIELGMKSYAGVRLNDRVLGPIGALWIADDKPINPDDMPLEILRQFAPSAASELATQKTLDDLD